MKSKNRRPVKIIRIIARLNIGGPAIHTVLLTDRMREPQYQSLLVTGRPEPLEGDMSYLTSNKIIARTVLPTLRRRLNPWSDWIAWIQIIKLLHRENPDIVHTHTAKAGALGRSAVLVHNLWLRLSSVWTGTSKPLVRTVHTFHGHVLEGYFGGWREHLFIAIERFLARYTDRIISVSTTVRDDLLRLGIGDRNRWCTVPLGLPLDTLLDLPLPNEVSSALRIGIVGRLVPIKNHDLLLRGIHQSRTFMHRTNVRFDIVGDGELRPLLERRTRSLDLSGVVAFTGWKQRIEDVYRNLDIVCLTSLNEGTPVSLIEALAAARPVIATDVGGVRDILGPIRANHGTFQETAHGLIIRSGDARGLESAWTYLVQHSVKRKEMGLAGRAFVRERFAADRLVSDMKTLYQEVLS